MQSYEMRYFSKFSPGTPLEIFTTISKFCHATLHSTWVVEIFCLVLKCLDRKYSNNLVIHPWNGLVVPSSECQITPCQANRPTHIYFNFKVMQGLYREVCKIPHQPLTAAKSLSPPNPPPPFLQEFLWLGSQNRNSDSVNLFAQTSNTTSHSRQGKVTFLYRV